MSAWIVITQANLQQYVVDAQLRALLTSALGSDQAAPLQATIQDRCNYVLNRIKGRVLVSATPFAVPPELVTDAALLIFESLNVRLSLGIQLTEDQVRMIRQAYRDLDIAGTREMPIDLPDDPVTPIVMQTGASISIVKKPQRVDSRKDWRGL